MCVCVGGGGGGGGRTMKFYSFKAGTKNLGPDRFLHSSVSLRNTFADKNKSGPKRCRVKTISKLGAQLTI